MAILTRPDAIVFDLDGTLADTFSLMADGFAVALEPRLGRRVTYTEVTEKFIGGGTERQILDEFVGYEDPEALQRYLAFYADQHHTVTLFPGIADALAACAATHLPLGLMTGKGRATAEITLAKLGIRHYFDVVITGDEATRPKPDPMGPLLALAALGIAPERSLFIGDTRADVRAGQVAGMHTIVVGWNNRHEAEETVALYHPDAAFYDSIEFSAWLRTLLGAQDTASTS